MLPNYHSVQTGSSYELWTDLARSPITSLQREVSDEWRQAGDEDRRMSEDHRVKTLHLPKDQPAYFD